MIFIYHLMRKSTSTPPKNKGNTPFPFPACSQSVRGNRREADHWGDLGVDGWIILGWISRRLDVGIWTGLGWPRIETDGGRL